jgi:hypothetical protein
MCTQCKKTFTILPPFLFPFKHYVASEIERVLCHIFNGLEASKAPSEASESTIWRWHKEFGSKMTEWMGRLEAIVFLLYKQMPDILQLTPHPLKRLEQTLSSLPALPAQWTVMTKTLWWLKNSHPL